MSFEWLLRLSAADRLRLLAFGCELRRLPRSLVSALWATLDSLEASSSSQTIATPGESSR